MLLRLPGLRLPLLSKPPLPRQRLQLNIASPATTQAPYLTRSAHTMAERPEKKQRTEGYVLYYVRLLSAL